MSKRGRVYNKGIFAGIIEKNNGEYIFTYDEAYINNLEAMSISQTLPKNVKQFRSPYLFAFFFGLLAEGSIKEIQCRKLKIDENDHFTRLLKTANSDVIGSITIEEEI